MPIVTCDRSGTPEPVSGRYGAIGVGIKTSLVVGDSIWDMLAARRARALGIGPLSGRYGQEELERASAYRVYADPAELLKKLYR